MANEIKPVARTYSMEALIPGARSGAVMHVELLQPVQAGMQLFTAAQLEQAVEQARREEREACARILDRLQREADDYFAGMGSAGCPEYNARDCAAAIRARNSSP